MAYELGLLLIRDIPNVRSRVRASTCDKEQVAPEAIDGIAGNHVKPTTAHHRVVHTPRVRYKKAPGS